MTRIAVIGVGKIGEALLAGLIAGGVPPKDIAVTNPDPERGKYLQETYGVVDFTDNVQAADGADYVFLCVKPKDTLHVLNEVSDVVDNNEGDTTVISMASGITLRSLEDAVPVGTPVIRVMPNTPMLVRQGVSALASGRFVSEENLEHVCELLESVGTVVVVAETDMDAVTALSGSSPAYAFLVAEAMIDAGVSLGLTRAMSRELTIGALYGAATMLKETGREPAELRADVSSPGGTTVAAIRKLEAFGLRSAFYDATEACALRSKELGRTRTADDDS
ncbi:pyrroline-5-carboxylate reductase [Corynebacterium freiburgense]|uniref:pyrroline-5-carboxylate reductase n=1 Tax=Corynebacterium freiburgense TaxID=556548 RepID=UPI0003FBB61D|nr:pyrroline-5-carboxylate reductase [Corynebacterium freiburgense]WJZ01555.1 Pyrroline-5-carboxylate reductase [Corynebacterium freiburgense]